MSEYLAAFVGSMVGVAVGIVACVHLGRRYEERRALARQQSKATHPAGGQTVPSEVEFEATSRKFRRSA